MGGIFSRFSTPQPSTIRKYGLMILLCLGVPKITWDILRIRQASTFVSTLDEDEKKDPPVRVLRLAAAKAMKDMNAIWDRVLVSHCADFSSHVAKLWQHVLLDAAEVTNRLAAQDELKNGEDAQNESENSGSDDDVDDDDDNDDNDDDDMDKYQGGGEDDEAHDGFLQQWQEMLSETIVGPLFEVSDIKEDDAAVEQEIRDSVKALYFMAQVGQTIIKSQRRHNARLRFVTAQAAIDNGKLEKTDPSYDSDVQEQLKRSLARSKKKLTDFYAETGTNAFAWNVFSPKRFQVGLTNYQHNQDHQELSEKNSNRSSSANHTGIPLTPEYDHYKKWSEYRTKQQVDEFHLYRYPTQLHDRIQLEFMQLACSARHVDVQCDSALGSIRKQRFMSLLNFVNVELCGGIKERLLIVFSWGLGSLTSLISATEWHYRSTLLIESIEATLRSRQKGAPPSALTLFDVCISIFVLKASHGLLLDMMNKIQTLAFGSIRRGLQQRVAHTILSQDMEDAVSAEGGRNNAASLIRSLSDSDEWNYGLGSIMLIPQTSIETMTNIITTSLLLWSKSPKLLILCALADLLTKRLQYSFYTLSHRIKSFFQLDKHEWRGWMEMRGIEDAISNFEDMRINAKEVDIEKHVIKTALLTENEEHRSLVVPQILKPFEDMINDLPTMVTAYVGGSIALGGGISAADLTNFTYQISNLVQTIKGFRNTLEALWKMEDNRFSYGLSLMDLLNSKPKMGIDSGWKPSKSSKSSNIKDNAQKMQRDDDDDDQDQDDDQDNVPLGGDLTFDNVSFRYRGMAKNMLKKVSFTIKAGSFVGICGERGAGKSTMYKLMMRLYDPNEGTITIDNHPLSYYNPVWLRSKIGM